MCPFSSAKQSSKVSNLSCPPNFYASPEASFHFLLQGIFLTQWLNPHLLHRKWVLYHWVNRETTGKILSGAHKFLNAASVLHVWNNYLFLFCQQLDQCEDSGVLQKFSSSYQILLFALCGIGINSFPPSR